MLLRDYIAVFSFTEICFFCFVAGRNLTKQEVDLSREFEADVLKKFLKKEEMLKNHNENILKQIEKRQAV